MMVRRVFAVMALVACCTMQAQTQNQLPPRPPIFLNNNASLYTFPNPNFGKPSQLPFAYVAVAHEDCRLFHNGAKLMPKHRLMAAECLTASNSMMPGGGGGVPIDPLTGLPIGNPGQGPIINGINYQRMRQQQMMMMAAQAYVAQARYMQAVQASSGGTAAGYSGYPMQPQPMLTTASAAAENSAAAQPRQYRGFGSFREFRYGGFVTALQADTERDFGKGFDGESDKGADPK